MCSIQDTQKESNCVDMCYQKSVSTALVQCLTRKREERSMFWKAVTEHKLIQSSKEDSSPCLVCQFTKQRYSCCVIAFKFFLWGGTGHALFNWHFPWHLHDFLSVLDFLSFSSETLEWRSRKTFVITRNDTITCLFVYLEWITTTFTHFVIHGVYSTEYEVCKSPL